MIRQHYSKGQFFVTEESLSDSSKVYNVGARNCVNGCMSILQYAENEQRALTLCDDLAAAVERSQS